MLASIQTVEEILPHPNADRLELARVGGYLCIVSKGSFSAGQPCVFIAPDSVLPEAAWSEIYRKFSKSRVKAQKIRGTWSFGIVESPEKVGLTNFEVGQDVSAQLGVIKYEAPQSNSGPSNARWKSNALPFGIVKTDEERWQGIKHRIPWGEEADWTLKIDGQSCSFYYRMDGGVFGALSRSLDLDLEESNNYTRHISKYGIREKLASYCERHGVSLCLRGESYGVGIQNFKINPHSKEDPAWAMFSVWDIEKMEYCSKGSPHYFLNVAAALDLPHVPVLETAPITEEKVKHYDEEISEINRRPFEGVVVQHSKGSFKIINKKYDSEK